MKKFLTEHKRLLSFAFLGWILLLIRHGYTFGTGDHAEILPYLSHLQNNKLYANDFYVQHIKAIVPNVRWVFVQCMGLFYPILKEAFFVFHAFYTLLLLFGSLRLAGKIGIQAETAFVGLMGYLLLLQGTIPGGNDWYQNNFQAENIAFVTGLFGLLAMLDEKPMKAALFFAIGTLFHPLAGMQFALLSFGTQVFTRKLHLPSLGIFMATGGVYFLWIILNQGSIKPALAQMPDYFSILFEFRQPHHSIPAAFPLTGWILSLLFAVVLFMHLKSQKSRLFVWLVLTIVGSIVYVVGTTFFKSVVIAQTQWFKTFALFFALGSMVLMHVIIKKTNVSVPHFHKGLNAWGWMAGLLVLTGYLAYPQINPLKKPMMVTGYFQDKDLLDICGEIRKKTPLDATFVIPFQCDAFNYYSQRSVYVSFKAVVHDEKNMREWYSRIGEIYGLTTGLSAGFHMTAAADSFYDAQLRQPDFGLYKLLPVQYALVRKNGNFHHVLFENESYQVLEIPSYANVAYRIK